MPRCPVPHSSQTLKLGFRSPPRSSFHRSGDSWLAPGMNAGARKIVKRLGLGTLPAEGGFFRRVWQSETRLANGRAASSSILFLLTADDFSAWHRLRSGELWTFIGGDPVEVVQIDAANGNPRTTLLGADWLVDEAPQCVIAANTWQAAWLKPGRIALGWALLGCTVTPAWDEKEFELGHRETLLREFPRAEALILALTR